MEYEIDHDNGLTDTQKLWQPLAFVITTLLFMGIAGCASSRPSSAAKAAPIPLPVYQEGTTFVYTGGRWETVEKIGPEGITWRNHRGHLSSGSADFTYQRARWETRARSGERHFRKRSDWLGAPSATSLWPLAPGKTARFIESGRWQDADGEVKTYEAQWRLEVVGPTRIRVRAGNFDSWKIVARRFSGGGAYKNSRLREIRTWYYAPEAGHYAKLERNYLGRRPNRVVELVAVTPAVDKMAPKARTIVHDTFQRALEEKQSGSPEQWLLAHFALSGTVTPLATFRLNSGTYCRQYVQQLNHSEGQNKYYGLACRTQDGQWQIPYR